jgi:hypothetical protein
MAMRLAACSCYGYAFRSYILVGISTAIIKTWALNNGVGVRDNGFWVSIAPFVLGICLLHCWCLSFVVWLCFSISAWL